MRLTPWHASPDESSEHEGRTADGIYGLIVSAAVMASAHLPTSGRLVVAVIVTLVVYWAAERYAAIVARRIILGHRRTWAQRRRELAEGWGVVTTSFIPLLVLVIVDLLGAELRGAVLTALACTTALLFLAGLRIGAKGSLSPAERLGSAAAASAFGLVLIALKVGLH